MKNTPLQFIFLLITITMASQLPAQQTCHTKARVEPITAATNPDPLNGDYCATVYVEVDHDIVTDKGPQGSRDFIEGLLAEVATLYAADDINLSFIIKYWDTPSPYSSPTSGGMLEQFRQRLAITGYDGDVAHLLSYQASGGIAYVDVICRQSFGFGFSSIRDVYRPFPEYSWSVEVISHELGHNFGSPHTQACVWNGNNTAIDACSPFGTEGGCPAPADPVNGGTIMSYCHLNANVGINFLNGFGPQPLSLIKNRIAAASCVECTDDPDVEVCDQNQIIVELQLDNYPTETRWQITDVDGQLVGASQPFTKLQMNTYQADTFCLPDGCYTFSITDVDGLAGYGCGEGMYIVNGDDVELASGQTFTGTEHTVFCLGIVPPDGDCYNIPIRKETLVDYANQSRARSPIVTNVDDVDGVEISGNYWQAQPLTYTITPTTVLTGQVWVENEGEINGVALVGNLTGIYPGRSFRFAGTQDWGIPIRQVPIGGWHDIHIPVGQYLPHTTISHLVLVNDDDVAGSVQTAWRNFELCESGSALIGKATLAKPQGTVDDERPLDVGLQPYPNPVVDTLNLHRFDWWFLTSIEGLKVNWGYGKKVSFGGLPSGVYLLRHGPDVHKIIKR